MKLNSQVILILQIGASSASFFSIRGRSLQSVCDGLEIPPELADNIATKFCESDLSDLTALVEDVTSINVAEVLSVNNDGISNKEECISLGGSYKNLKCKNAPGLLLDNPVGTSGLMEIVNANCCEVPATTAPVAELEDNQTVAELTNLTSSPTFMPTWYTEAPAGNATGNGTINSPTFLPTYYTEPPAGNATEPLDANATEPLGSNATDPPTFYPSWYTDAPIATPVREGPTDSPNATKLLGTNDTDPPTFYPSWYTDAPVVRDGPTDSPRPTFMPTWYTVAPTMSAAPTMSKKPTSSPTMSQAPTPQPTNVPTTQAPTGTPTEAPPGICTPVDKIVKAECAALDDFWRSRGGNEWAEGNVSLLLWQPACCE